MMQTFDGISLNSILIVDNCSIHHVSKVKELLCQLGIVLLFLPPYSPDLNPPVEEALRIICVNVTNYYKQFLIQQM